jgi:CheY-like chemotaxis protein
MLAGLGYRIIVAQNGEQALNIIDKEVPDAMILDLMMPGIDGFSVLEKVRNAERTAHVPVLVLTAKHMTKDDLKFLKRNNVHQLIQKGDVNKNELLGAIASMVPVERAIMPLSRKSAGNIRGKPVVLIVEDNKDNMLTMKALLAQDFILLEATSGHEGEEKAKKHTPHCILMDISLPGKDGIEAFKAIRNHASTAHIPVIAVTASAMTTDRETILAHGFDAYVAKPIDAKQLLTCMHGILYGK